MKRLLSFAAILLISAVITGCEKGGGDSASEVITENVISETTIYTDISNSFTASVDTTLTRSELDRVLSVFEEFAYLDRGLYPDLDYSGCCCDYVPECVDMSRFFTEEIAISGGLRKFTYSYYKVASGDYSTETGFNAKLDEIFTNGCKERYLELTKDNYRFRDNETYVTDLSYLSYEPIGFRIEIAAERSDENIVITLTDNNANTVNVTLVTDEDGNYRIDKLNDLMRIPDWFVFNNDLELVYGDDVINRHSAWDTTISSEIPKLWSLTRFEQCLSMLKDYGYINYEIKLGVDTSQSVTEDWADYPFYKVVESPFANEELFLQKLSLIFTEKCKERYLSDPSRKFTFKDGNLYAAMNEPQSLSANDGYFMLDSVEIPDDDTMLMTFTAAYAPPDGKEKYSVKFVKESGGFYKIDEIRSSGTGIDIAECLWFYSELIYANISISI